MLLALIVQTTMQQPYEELDHKSPNLSFIQGFSLASSLWFKW